MKRNEADQIRKDQNRDAWYGIVHVKDRSYLHQRSMKHYYYNNSSEADVVVPLPLKGAEDVNTQVFTAPKKTKRIIGIAIVCLLAMFVLFCLICMAREDIGNVFPLVELYLSPCD